MDKNLRTRIEKMPKAEIHVHLEGATTAETVWTLAAKNGVKLPAATLEEWKRFYDFRDFNHFIEVYMLCASCMRTPEDFAFMTEEFHRYQADQNILYTEAFLSASMFIGKLDFSDLIDAFEEGCRAGELKHGVKVKFIPDIGRQFPETQKEVLRFTKMGFDRGLFLGLGLGGIEQGFPPELFAKTYAEARDYGMHVVAHAGEAAGAESVKGSLEFLKAERIGHGIRCLEDEYTTAMLRELQTPIEVCPVSNYRTRVIPEGARHPIRRMMDAGLFCTVNSDDPTMFSTSLTGEYLTLAEQGFTWDELWQLNKNTLEATFLPEQEKSLLRHQWNDFAPA